MCAPALIIAGAQVAQGAMSGYSKYQQGIAESKSYSNLAARSRQESDLALKRGETQTGLIQESAKAEGQKQAVSAAELSAAQKATLAANGISLDSVTAQDIVLDTASKSAKDEMAIRYNADVKSWQAKTEAGYHSWQALDTASQYDRAAKESKAQAKREIFSTLLGTATQVASTGSKTGLFTSKK